MSLSMNVYLMSSTTTRHSQLKKIRISNFTPSPQIDFTRKATPAHSVVTASGGSEEGPPNHPKPFSHHALCSTPGHLAQFCSAAHASSTQVFKRVKSFSCKLETSELNVLGCWDRAMPKLSGVIFGSFPKTFFSVITWH